MAHPLEADQHKRKRDATDDGSSQIHDRIPQPPPPQSGNAVPINYLSRSLAGKLRLVQGDSDSFSEVLGLINEYEGVLNRHESLALNLGAKLTGARLLKAMEGAFEGSITTTPHQDQFTSDPVTWLDIVDFAKSHPQEFQLSSTPSGLRYCQFPLKGVQVEIGEDDWRLIISGALDRFRLVPPQPLEEDETAELATVEILEHRLQVLIKKADEVARRARQLNYHLSGRKASIHSRHPPRSGSSIGFQPVNSIRQVSATPGYDLHTDLLEQFMGPAAQTLSHRVLPTSPLPPTPNPISAPSTTTRASVNQQNSLVNNNNRPSPSDASEPATKERVEDYRMLVTAKMEKITKGAPIKPPCDRCRRLQTVCTKNQTACQGCTRKHSKCTWMKVTPEEAMILKGDMKEDTSGEGDEEEEEPADAVSKSNFASPRLLPGIGDLGVMAERSVEPAMNQAAPRPIMWHKGPSSILGNREDSMDIDTSSARPRYSTGSPNISSYMSLRGPSLDSFDTRMVQMAEAATARADAVVRESQHRQ
ncbi:hypothetical protein F4777DRAFT_535871 [Nemania sp. FL0916]|nr:hypothetical protein F4777DRAFT_535871 [Nemania sp. FL0916]